MSTNTTPPRSQSRLGYEQSGRALQQAPAQQNALATIDSHKKFLAARRAKLGEWAANRVKPDAIERFILAEMADNDRLRACTPESVYIAFIACAVTGLEPGPLKGECYLVPYKNKGVMEATFQRGYKGVIKMALRSRFVKSLRSNVVYEGDFFEVDDGSANRIIHKLNFGSRGKDIIAAYAIAKLTNGEEVHEVMDRDDLDAVRKAGSDSPAWKDWPDQMMRKAPIHRLGKFLQFDEAWHVANALDNARTIDEQRRIIDVEASGEATAASTQAAIAAEMAAQAGADQSHESEEDMIKRMEAEQARRERSGQ